jgi:hypothetical protein
MRYIAIAIDDAVADWFVERIEKDWPAVQGVKQVVLDNVPFEEVEKLS